MVIRDYDLHKLLFKKDFIDKACKYLSHNTMLSDAAVDRFRKHMEESI